MPFSGNAFGGHRLRFLLRGCLSQLLAHQMNHCLAPSHGFVEARAFDDIPLNNFQAWIGRKDDLLRIARQIRTVWPLASNHLSRWLPTKPVAPVRSNRMARIVCVLT